MSNSHSRPRLVAKQACAEACASVCRRRFISRTSPLAWALLIFPGVCRACAIVCRRRRDADGRRTDGRTTDGPDVRTDGREWTGDGRTDDGDDGRTDGRDGRRRTDGRRTDRTDRFKPIIFPSLITIANETIYNKNEPMIVAKKIIPRC